MYVRDAIEKLSRAGYVAYLVGGCVRDFLLQKPIKDFDLATDALPDQLAELFPNAIDVGKQFGVIKVPIESGVVLEIATFREDLEYVDHRHPSHVRFAGPEEDARRRDFTINALYLDPRTQRLLDTVGGVEDLKLRMIRAIGDPKARFKEDALRLLRAVRFATRFGFEIDQETDLAIRERGRLLLKISSERVRDELNLMLESASAAQALALLSNNGLLAYVLPEVESLRLVPESPAVGSATGRTVFQQELRVLEALIKQNPSGRTRALIWGAVLQSAGKAIAHSRNSGKSFNGHELEGAKLARAVCSRLKFPTELSDRVVHLVEEQLKFGDVFRMREATLQRFLRSDGFAELLALHRAQATCSDGNLAAYEFCASRYRELLALGPGEGRLLKGEDLVQLGLSPGPRFSEILRDVEDQAFEGKIKTKDEALEYVVKHYVR